MFRDILITVNNSLINLKMELRKIRKKIYIYLLLSIKLFCLTYDEFDSEMKKYKVDEKNKYECLEFFEEKGIDVFLKNKPMELSDEKYKKALLSYGYLILNDGEREKLNIIKESLRKYAFLDADVCLFIGRAEDNLEEVCKNFKRYLAFKNIEETVPDDVKNLLGNEYDNFLNKKSEEVNKKLKNKIVDNFLKENSKKNSYVDFVFNTKTANEYLIGFVGCKCSTSGIYVYNSETNKSKQVVKYYNSYIRKIKKGKANYLFYKVAGLSENVGFEGYKALNLENYEETELYVGEFDKDTKGYGRGESIGLYKEGLISLSYYMNEDLFSIYYKLENSKKNIFDFKKEFEITEKTISDNKNYNLSAVLDDKEIMISYLPTMNEGVVSKGLKNSPLIEIYKNSGGYFLGNAAVKISQYNNECTGEQPTVIESKKNPIMFLVNPKLPLGKVESFEMKNMNFFPNNKFYFTFKNEDYFFRSEGEGETPYGLSYEQIKEYDSSEVRNYKVYFGNKIGNEELILEVEYFHGSFLKLIFAGDLDKDGKPDFIFNVSSDYECEEIVVFLSSKHAKGRLLKRVTSASFDFAC